MEVIVVSHSLSVKTSWKSMKYINYEFYHILRELSNRYKVRHITIDKSYKIANNDVLEKSLDYCQIIYYTEAINFRDAINWLKEFRPNAVHNIAIFGNLLSNPRRIKEYTDLLRGNKLRFLFASKAYQDLASKFFINLNSTVIPFSIEQNYNEGYSKKKWDFIYAGRINSSKGIDSLLSTFSKKKFSHLKLAIAGDFDKSSYPLRGVKTNIEALKELFKNLPDNIFYLGNLNHTELIDSFKNSSCFISLSSFTSEDFGYAPLQALYNGCNLILSRWGGLKQYEKYRQVRYISLSEGIGHHFISEEALEDLLKDYISSNMEKDFVQDYCRNKIYLRWESLLKVDDSEFFQSRVSDLYYRYIDLYLESNRKPFSIKENQNIYRLIFHEFK